MDDFWMILDDVDLRPKIFWHLAATSFRSLGSCPALGCAIATGGRKSADAPLRPGLPKDSWMLPRLATAAKTRTAKTGGGLGREESDFHDSQDGGSSWAYVKMNMDVEIDGTLISPAEFMFSHWHPLHVKWHNRHNASITTGVSKFERGSAARMAHLERLMRVRMPFVVEGAIYWKSWRWTDMEVS